MGDSPSIAVQAYVDGEEPPTDGYVWLIVAAVAAVLVLFVALGRRR